MKKTIEQLHLVAQYLAAAGISFLNKELDDSHTNVGWNSDKKRMETHAFGSGNHQLAINLERAHLEWLKDGFATDSIDLQQNTHSSILIWISALAAKNEIKQPYSYNFHYDLPYATIGDNDKFTFKADALNEIIAQLNIGQNAFETFLDENDLASPIRIWPHHFDLGVYASINSEGSIFMAAGLAIPDSLVDDLYYYASAYNDGTEVVSKNLTGLTIGDWRSDWNGATLPSSQIDAIKAINFLNEARKEFLNHV
ncbi:MAG: hypothetical protein GQ574_03905 [Crocinitomix sp.]|nr:hypothetical protein [Crocinitomix sp.]